MKLRAENKLFDKQCCTIDHEIQYRLIGLTIVTLNYMRSIGRTSGTEIDVER